MLVRGPSGAGKSELALRALAAGWRLVADDRTLVWRSGQDLYGKAPARLAGLIEVRGVDVVAEAALPFAALALALDACDSPERLPEPGRFHLQGLAVPCIRLALREPAAVAKLEKALAVALRARL